MPVIYSNFRSGVVDNNPLLIGGTSLSSTALANFPTVTAPDTAWIVLDPEGTAGAPEIVQVTAHTASATTATIVRGQQTSSGGGAARQHLQNTVWVMPVTAADLHLAAPTAATVATSQSTSSTTFTDLATVVSVTLTTGTLVCISAVAEVTAIPAAAPRISVAISGATTVAAGTTRTLEVGAGGAAPTWTNGSALVAVTAGTNTFTLKFRSQDGSSVTFQNRSITVERLN